MKSNPKLSYAIAAILSAGPAGLAHAAAGAEAAASDQLQEVTVTAQRRVEKMQDVPITIQALTSDTLAQLNISNFDDLLRYLPNVSSASNGAGQNNIYMRGLSIGGNYSQGSGGVGPFPNVAVYLDDQSAQIPGRNLDIYAADIDRIEVLEGPQGTLFGSGSEAGVLRYITNKPKIDVTEAHAEADYGYTSHGDPNTKVEAVLNLPLIAGKLAVRGVIYDDARGGYINSVPGTFVRSNNDPSIHYAGYSVPASGVCPNGLPTTTGFCVPPGSPVISNNANVGNAINPVTYKGIRVQALYTVNDDWNALIAQSYQRMDSSGEFFQTATGSNGEPLPDLSVVMFNPTYDNDWFSNTALTVDGRLGDLKLVYSGAYMNHHAEAVQDYTNYARGVYADYYQCLPGANPPATSKCYSTSTTWYEHLNDVHQSHELRVSTPDDWRLRGIGGVLWEDYLIREDNSFAWTTAPGFAPLQPPPGTTVYNPNVRADNVGWVDDIVRGYRQMAAFASFDFDIIPKTLTATIGTRYFKFTNTERGVKTSQYGCYVGVPTTTPCFANATSLDAENLHDTATGSRSRANLSWKITDDILVYGTFSQGFRPGGFNRTAADHALAGGYIYTTPIAFSPDSLTNIELGWKTELLNRRVQINGALYQENWKNVQVEFFDPQAGLGNITFVTNGPNYRVRGLELQTIARVTHGLTLTGSASWNSSNQTNSPFLIATKGPLAGQPITSIPNPYGNVDSPTSQSPPFQGNLRARYEFAVNDYKAFWQLGGQHQAHSYSATGLVQNYDLPSFTTYDGAIGIGKDQWIAQIYGHNLTDTRAILFSSSYEFIKADTVNRPRTVGLNISYKF